MMMATMMMGQRNLHDLLEQDQEPFLLKNYLADRRSRLKNHLRRRPTNDAGVLHIPEPTAALLLEAAARIHDQSKPKSKGKKKISVGIFDSIFKILGNRSSNRTGGDEISVKKSIDAGNSHRHHRTVWSEKSRDLESCSSSSSASEESPATEKNESLTSISREKQFFCSSPQSPFRFSLFRTPEFSSPDASSGRRSKEGDEIHEANAMEIYDHQIQVEAEEEKEQCSPVSVLEPLFQDEEDKGEDYESEMESSYAIMQKAKHQLLEKLRRFERLAQLDPLELDKTLFEDEYYIESEEEDCIVMEVISESGIVDQGIKRLVFDLTEEEKVVSGKEEDVSKRVCMRLEKWKEAKRESIDMMVEMDLRRDRIDGWERIDENSVKEVGKEIGISILGELIEEELLQLL